MTVPTLPVDGQTNWGDPLNTGILQVNTNAASASTAAANHAANIPADPHGDRAYAQGLVTPITTGVNSPNGYVKLNSQGQLPAGLVAGTSGGAFTNVYDVVAQYSAVPNTGTDQSTHIQNALNAASAAGGGIVWIPAGTFSLAKYLVIGNNTTIWMSQGTVLSRIAGSPTPPYLISNVQFNTSNTPSTNISIIGGKLDAVGAAGLGSACTPIFIIQSTNTLIYNVLFNSVFNNPAIEFNGCTSSVAAYCTFGGQNKVSGATTVPAVRLNVSDSTTTPSGLAGGLYNDATCKDVRIDNCAVQALTNTVGPFASFVGSDLVAVTLFMHQNITITGGGIPYNNSTNFATPSIFANQSWEFFYISGVLTPETSKTQRDGWNILTLQHGWSNSGFGPTAQFRLVPSNNGGNANAFSAVGTMVELIGDLTGGTLTDSTVVFTLPSWISLTNTHIVPLLVPGTNSASNMRFQVSATDNTVSCLGLSSLGASPRITYHVFVPTID